MLIYITFITKHVLSLIFLSFRLSSDHTTNLFDLPTTPFPYDVLTAENCFNMVHGCFAISVITTKDIQVGSVGSMERMQRQTWRQTWTESFLDADPIDMPICLVTVLIDASRKTQDSEHFNQLL